jgi:hypothetical protein
MSRRHTVTRTKNRGADPQDTALRCRTITDAAKDLVRSLAEAWLAAGDLDALEVADARGQPHQVDSLRILAETLDGCLYHFDQIQLAAGLQAPDEPRYRRFLLGQ